MEMYVRYHNLPEGVTPDTLKLELANLLEEDGWLTGVSVAGASVAGAWSWRTS